MTTCKDTLYGRLKIEHPGAGYIHHPMSCDRTYFEGLLAERAVVLSTGARRYDVIPGRKNDPVDLHSYNLAALRLCNPEWERLRREGVGREQLSLKVFKAHKDTHCDGEVKLNPTLPIIVCCDFKNPMTWILCQTDKKKVWAFDEIAIRNADTMQMGMEVLRRYGGHKSGLIIYGPATGAVRASTGKSDHAALTDLGLGRQRYKRTVPPPADLINAVNNMLENLAGESRLTYHPDCILLKKDLGTCIYDEDKEIERVEFGRGHAFDALSHFIFYEFPLRAKRVNSMRYWK